MTVCMKDKVKCKEIDTYNVYNEVRQFPGIVRREVVATAFDKKHLCVEFTMEIFKSLEVRANVFPY